MRHTGFLGWVAILILTALAGIAGGATTIDVSNTVVVPSVKHFGINLGWVNYFDSGQIMKQLVFRNPGFEGQIFQSIVRCASGTASSCTDDLPYTPANPPPAGISPAITVWPDGFWNGATYEFIWGAASGRIGTVSSSTAPSGGNGTLFQFADSAIIPAAGDYMIVRKTSFGTDCQVQPPQPGCAATGWISYTSGGASITTEAADLAPDTIGHQAVRISATGQGQSATLSAVFETSTFGTFLQLNGSYRLSFKARAAAGSGRLTVNLRRQSPSNTIFMNQIINLSNSWNTYSIDFSATENGSASGAVQLQFSPGNQTAVLLDDVSLIQTDGDSANTTAFRDPAVDALLDLHPGILRYSSRQFGDSLDNQIAPLLARLRPDFVTRATTANDIQLGLHEFLELSEYIGAEPWYCFPSTFSTQEAANLMEYLAGSSATPYGARRAARGRIAPWTDTFSRIHLEFGNEVWNHGDFAGEAIFYAEPHGNRASEIFGTMKSSPYYNSSQFDLILGGQASYVSRNAAIHNASVNHDTFAVGPYLAYIVDNYANNEELFGPLFAEPEMLSQTGYLRQDYDTLQASARPVPMAVYEVNVHPTQGAISQDALNSFTPSVGAGIAVANHMLMMLRDLGIKDQLLYSFTQYANPTDDGGYVLLWGAERDLGVTNRKRPQYLALQLANEALTGDLLQTNHSGDNPTWNQPFVNYVQYDNAHFLQSYGFANGNNRSLVLFNFSRTGSLTVNFTGSSAPGGTVTLRQLTAAAITDNNENAENVIVSSQTLNNFDPNLPLSLLPYSMTLLQWQADTIVPAVAITSPANGASISGTVPVSADASDNAGVARVEFYRDNAVSLGTDTFAPYSVDWDSSGSPGAHTIYATAYDTSANAGTSTTITVSVLDVVPPSVTLTNPTNGGTVSGNTTVTISATASDTVGVTRVDFYVNNAVRCSDTTAAYSCKWRVPKKAGGTYTLQARAYDAAGNSATSVVTVTSR